MNPTPAPQGLTDAQVDAILLHYAWDDDETVMLGHAAIHAEERKKLRRLIAPVSPIQPAVGGMTDEEIMDAAREHCHDFRWPSSAIAIARAIEAKAATRQTGGVDQAWVDKAMELAQDLETMALVYGECEPFRDAECLEDMLSARHAFRSHLSTALGAKGKS